MFSIFPRIIAEEVGPMMRMADELARWPVVMGRMVQPLSRRESEVHNTDTEVRIRMNLQPFKPEEVKITSDSQCITVFAKHEEKRDEQDFVAREVTHVYKIPDNADPKSVTSAMNDYGVLSIKIQMKVPEAPKETPIPVNFK